MRRVLALLVIVLGLASPAMAATPKTSATDIEDEVMCVACGVPLDIAESPQATRERAYIRNLVAQGKTKDQVKSALVATYGDRVLATPKDSGFGLAAYLVPIAIALLAIVAGLVFVPRWRNGRPDGEIAPEGPRLSDADAQRVAEDLARYEV
jgi:cytochrome c-type biogenesis protein CcmH/NrfF